MKTLKKLLFTAFLALTVSFAGQAQEVAHINTQELIAQMPGFKSANEQLTKMREGFAKDYEQMLQEFQTKAAKFQQEQATAGDAVNETRMKELEDLRNRVQQLELNADSELNKKQEELLKPVMEKAHAAIQKTARAKGYKYVLDATMGGGVIVADGPDLMSDVKKELNIN